MREVGYYSYEFSLDQVHWVEDDCHYNYQYLLNPRGEEIVEIGYDDIGKYTWVYPERDGFLGLFGNPIKTIKSWDNNELNIHENDIVYVRKKWHKLDPTIETLSSRLGADDFIQYIQDRGISVCPMRIM